MNLKRHLILSLIGLAAAAAGCMSADATSTAAAQTKPEAENPACDRWVDSVYNSLTERQRVAQLISPKIAVDKGADSRAAIRRYVSVNKVGSLLFASGTIDQYIELTNYAQSLADVPLLMTFDGEWGLSMRIKDTPRFPKNMALGAIRNPTVLYDYGREMARECRLAGITVNYAPVLDVNSNPDNPVIGERSFGEDPVRVGRLATAYARGLESGGVMAVAKHFPGHGNTSTDSHKERTTDHHNAADVERIDLHPFKTYIDSGCSGIMTGHIIVPSIDASGLPASLSQTISTELLRERLGFDGLVFTDALEMKGAKIAGRNNAVMALKAGADILESSGHPLTDIDSIMAAVKRGEISKSDIERHCKRVLRYKYLLGLPELKPADAKAVRQLLDSPEADLVNRRLAAALMTVVYNRGDILPVSGLEKNKIAVVNIGAPADNEFSRTCRRYADAEVFHTAGAVFSHANLERIKAHDIVIAAVYNGNAGARAVLDQLKDCRGLVAVMFVNPYKMSKFASSLPSAAALVAAYEDTPYTQEYAAQAVFGGIDVDGQLPVGIAGVAPVGTGMTLKKNRLGYSSPLAENMRASLTDSIDSICTKLIADGGMPGCQVLVAKNGNVVYDKCFGLITRGGARVTPTTVYDLASVSKATGTLPGVMKAYDMGLFGLDEPLAKYVPGLRGTGKDSLMIKEFLYHETGMPAALNMFEVMVDSNSYTGKMITRRPDRSHSIKIQKGAYGHNTARLRRDITSRTASGRFPVEAARGVYVGRETYDTIMSRIYNIPLRNNKNYNYSCLNFCLMMDLVQRVTGQCHDKFMADSIYGPLGAYTTCYRPTLKHPLTKIAPTENDTFLRRQTVHGYVHDELANFSGGVQGNAGLFSNADDLAKLCQMWLNGGTYGGRRFLSDETVKLFTTSKSPTCRRGLGFDKPDTENPEWSPTCDEADPSVFGHLGFTGTVFWVDSNNDMIFIFLTNRVNPTRDSPVFNNSGIRPELFRQVYKALN